GFTQHLERGRVAFSGRQVRSKIELVRDWNQMLLRERPRSPALPRQRSGQPREIGLPEILHRIVRERAPDQREIAVLPLRRERMIGREMALEMRRRVHANAPIHPARNACASLVPPACSFSMFWSRTIFSGPASHM